jgi:hypothetical protein
MNMRLCIFFAQLDSSTYQSLTLIPLHYIPIQTNHSHHLPLSTGYQSLTSIPLHYIPIQTNHSYHLPRLDFGMSKSQVVQKKCIVSYSFTSTSFLTKIYQPRYCLLKWLFQTRKLSGHVYMSLEFFSVSTIFRFDFETISTV